MTERPWAELPEPYRITAVALGAAIGIFVVLYAVLDVGLGEIALIVGPMLAAAALALAYYLWAERHADR